MTLLYKQYTRDDRLSSLLSELEELKEELNKVEMNDTLREMYLGEIEGIREYILGIMRDTSIDDYILEDELYELSKRVLGIREELYSYKEL